MTRPIKAYVRPTSWETVHEILADPDQTAFPLFLPLRPQAPEELPGEIAVDLSNLGLNLIREEGGCIKLGTLVTLQEIVDSELLKNHFNDILSQCAEISGSLGMRNFANLGGVLINQSGPVEMVLGLLALDARVILHTKENQIKSVDLTNFLIGNKHSFQEEIPVEIQITLDQTLHEKASLFRVARTLRDQAIAAVVVKTSVEKGAIHSANFALGGVTPLPQRLTKVEDFLQGQRVSYDVVEKAAEMASSLFQPKDDFLASASYRKAMIMIIVKRALNSCCDLSA